MSVLVVAAFALVPRFLAIPLGCHADRRHGLRLLTIGCSVPALLALAVVVGAGLGFGQPLSMTLVVQLVPENARATALAVRLTGNRLGQGAAPAAAGAIAGTGGTARVLSHWSGAGSGSVLPSCANACSKVGCGCAPSTISRRSSRKAGIALIPIECASAVARRTSSA